MRPPHILHVIQDSSDSTCDRKTTQRKLPGEVGGASTLFTRAQGSSGSAIRYRSHVVSDQPTYRDKRWLPWLVLFLVSLLFATNVEESLPKGRSDPVKGSRFQALLGHFVQLFKGALVVLGKKFEQFGLVAVLFLEAELTGRMIQMHQTFEVLEVRVHNPFRHGGMHGARASPTKADGAGHGKLTSLEATAGLVTAKDTLVVLMHEAVGPNRHAVRNARIALEMIRMTPESGAATFGIGTHETRNDCAFFGNAKDARELTLDIA